MKPIFFLLIFSALPMILSAQTKAQKCSYRMMKVQQNGEWSKPEQVDVKFNFNFKTKEFEEIKSDGSKKTYKMQSFTEATDESSLEDCYLIRAEYEGQACKLVLFRSDIAGLRIVCSDGITRSYYTPPKK